MIYIFVIGLVAINAAWLIYRDKADERSQKERSELYSRIQHPEIVHTDEVPQQTAAPVELDDFHLIGRDVG